MDQTDTRNVEMDDGSLTEDYEALGNSVSTGKDDAKSMFPQIMSNRKMELSALEAMS